MARHSFMGELRQEHGNEGWQAPLGPKLVWADSCQPQDVLRDLWGFALQHAALAQTQGRRCQATEAARERQTHAGEEASPPRHVLILLEPLQGQAGGEECAKNQSINSGYRFWEQTLFHPSIFTDTGNIKSERLNLQPCHFEVSAQPEALDTISRKRLF